MSDHGEQYNTWFTTTNLSGKGFDKGNPFKVTPVYKTNDGFVFRAHIPDKYSKSGWVCATTLDGDGLRFYHMVDGKRIPLKTLIHRMYNCEIQSHHNPYELNAGDPIEKNKIFEHFDNKPCTGFFVTAQLSNGSLVLVRN
jgi:hypothetical protein